MKLTLLAIGKTDEQYLQEGIKLFEKRLHHYLPFDFVCLQVSKPVKTKDTRAIKETEGKILLEKIQTGDKLILLDEKGKEFRSVEFASFMQQQMNSGIKNLIFAIGGAYGFSPEVYSRANGTLALSKLTFSHQMVRLFFIEQCYRAMSILRNEPYHNE